MRVCGGQVGDRAVSRCAVALVACGTLAAAAGAGDIPVVPYDVFYDAPDSLDEDDMCVWVHPTDPALSTIVVADKFAGIVYVYDLAGNVIQQTTSPSPRNIDTRYGVRFDETCIDVVAFNDREEEIIRVYKVDPASRHITRIDDGQIVTDRNYGFSLYHHADGRLYGITGSRFTGLMSEYLLFDNGLGQMTGAATDWHFQETVVEGIVGDDETGYLYLAEEEVGIWRINALDDTDRTLIALDGDESGLDGDLEGIAIYYGAGGGGYIVVSSQGASKYTLLDRQPPHEGRGNFQVEGVVLTDGLDVLNMNLGPVYPQGVFLVHNGGSNCCSVHGVRWEVIADALDLTVDTESWDPRQRQCVPLAPVVRLEEHREGGAVGSETVSTGEALAAAPDHLYAAAVASRPPREVTGVEGLGLGWSPLQAQCGGRDQTAIEVWIATGPASGDGPVTATFASAPTSAVIGVNRFSNVAADPIGQMMSGNTNGPGGECSGGIDGDAYAFDFDTQVEGAFVFGAVAMRNRTHMPAVGIRERSEVSAGSAGGTASVATVDVQVWLPQPTALAGTLSGDTDWAVIGFEILPAEGTADPCPWDVDEDGAVGTSDLLIVLSQWGMSPNGPPDLDGDGTVGTADLLLLLGNWGPC